MHSYQNSDIFSFSTIGVGCLYMVWYAMFICSSTMNVITVWGPSLRKYGVNPFHKLRTPSVLAIRMSAF